MKRDVQAFLRRAARTAPPPAKSEPDASDYLKIALGHQPDVQPEPTTTDPKSEAKAGANTAPLPPDPPSANDLLRQIAAR